jgi:hypothetical protein
MEQEPKDYIDVKAQIFESPLIEGAKRATTQEAFDTWAQDSERKYPVTIFVPNSGETEVNNNEAGKVAEGLLKKHGWVDFGEKQ